jgi:hypothetical protein
MSQSWQDAGEEIAQLEEITGSRLSEVPVHLVDQWGAGVRDLLHALGVERLDREASRAALGGAYLVATLTLTGSVVPAAQLETTAHVLRWLYEKGEQDGS